MPFFPDSIMPARFKSEADDAKGNRQIVSAADHNLHDEEIRAIEQAVGPKDNPCSLAGMIATLANKIAQLRDETVETSSGVVAIRDPYSYYPPLPIDGKIPFPSAWHTTLISDIGENDNGTSITVADASNIPDEGYITIINDISPAMRQTSYGETLSIISPSFAYACAGIPFEFEIMTSVPATVSVSGTLPAWISLSGNKLSGHLGGLFASSGSMLYGREYHTATILKDGSILVVGGYFYDGITSFEYGNAEIYNPITGKWSFAGQLNFPRQGHTATLLSDGRVLVAGGNQAADITTAEIYDPKTNAWSLAGEMSDGRWYASATLLPTGEVLIAGGAPLIGALDTTEIYTPNTGTGSWRMTGSMNHARYKHGATLLNNGKVLVAGGTDSFGTLSSCELYNPATGTWVSTGNLANPRDLQGQVLLNDGNVFVFGSQPGTITAEKYNPAAEIWSSISTPLFPFSTCRNTTATLLQDGKILVLAVGNAYTFSGGIKAVYDSVADTWTFSDIITFREGSTATLLNNGKVLITGGYPWGSGSGTPVLNSTELFIEAVTSQTTGTLIYPLIVTAKTDTASVAANLTIYAFQDQTQIDVTGMEDNGTGYYNLVPQATEGESYSIRIRWTPLDMPMQSMSFAWKTGDTPINGISMIGNLVIGTPQNATTTTSRMTILLTDILGRTAMQNFQLTMNEHEA